MINTIVNVIGTILYPLCGILFLLIDMIQEIFYGFAGIGKISIGGGLTNNQDAITVDGQDDAGIIYYILQSDLVKNLLLSIVVLAFVLLVIFTIMAFLKNIYSAKPRKWQEIIGDAIKGLGMFTIIPVLCLLGVWVGNIILRAIDGATNQASSTSTKSLSAMLFQVVAYNANDIRAGHKDLDDVYDELIKELNTWNNAHPDEKIDFVENKKDDADNLDVNYYAGLLDDLYTSNSHDRINWIGVGKWYALGEMNYTILIGGGIFMLYALCAISFGMVKRLFMLIVLFVISPVMCSLYPLRGDGPVKSWTSDFVKQTISAYSAVAGMNIMFALLPFIQTVSVGNAIVDVLGLMPLLLTIAALYMVKDIIALISNYIGAADAYAIGSTTQGGVKGQIDKRRKTVRKGALRVTGAFSNAASFAKKNAHYIGDTAEEFGGGFTGNVLGGGLGSLVVGIGTVSTGIASLVAPEVTKQVNSIKKEYAEIKSEQEGVAKKADYLYNGEDSNNNVTAKALDDATKEIKEAGEELQRLLSDQNMLLRRLATDKEGNLNPNAMDQIRARGVKGLTYTKEEMDAATPEEKSRMIEVNRYIEKVRAQQTKYDDASIVVETYYQEQEVPDEATILAMPDGREKERQLRRRARIIKANEAQRAKRDKVLISKDVVDEFKDIEVDGSKPPV